MKLTYDIFDYEYAVSEYGDLELTFHEYWKHGFYYKNEETGITVLFRSNDIYRIPLKLNETINSTAYLHHNKDCDGNYHKEQELEITIYTVKEMDNMNFCGCGCIIANNEYKCDDCKEKL